MTSILVIGLGNPGTEYEATRHNVGFTVVEELSRRWKKPFSPGTGEYLATRARVEEKQLVLVKPLTYMNNSGLAVAEALERYEASPEQIIVVADDFALPLGRLRLRPGGSDGGHNGLYSIIYHLQSDEFPRLRCGIGQQEPPRASDAADFVLSPFGPEEVDTVREMIGRAADAVMEFALAGIERAMNRCNM